MQSVEYASMPMMMATAMYFLKAVLPGRWYRKATHFWALGLGIPLLLVAVLHQSPHLARYCTVYQLHILGTLVVVLDLSCRGLYPRAINSRGWCILAFLVGRVWRGQ